MEFNFDGKVHIQSEFLNLQSSGSTGKDSPKGIHLRWFFTGQLGDYHLPLGDKGIAADLINRGEDYVYIYKLPYNKIKERSKVILDFEKPPFFIHPYLPNWTYRVGDIFFQVNFLDIAIYQATKLEYNYLNTATNFYKAYCSKKGKIELNLLKEEMCFAIDFDSEKEFQRLKIESFSKSISNGKEIEVISNRIDLEFGNPQSEFTIRIKREGILGENMTKVRYEFKGNDAEEVPSEFNFYLYSKAIKQFKNQEEEMKLSLTNNIDKDWDTVKGDLKLEEWARWKNNRRVSIKNYKLKHESIFKYLRELVKPNNDFIQDLYRKLQYSYKYGRIITKRDDVFTAFKSLELSSLDYHIARMLGFGISDEIDESDKESYIYLMEYKIKKNGYSKRILKAIPDGQHLYLSLPTSAVFDKKAEHIDLLPIEYGFVDENNTVVDRDGYMYEGLSRYIRLHSKKFDYKKTEDFFKPDFKFSTAHLSPSIFTGILSSRIKEGEREDKRELTLDKIDEEQPTEEIQPVVIQSNIVDPTYIHKLEYPDDDNSIHEYELYPIDIFSRAGNESNLEKTDNTRFNIPNLLLPPSNVSVKLIQKEDHLIFTDQNDQERLAKLLLPFREEGEHPNIKKNKVLVKVTFDYNHIHDMNSTKLLFDETNHFGEEVEFFFRTKPQRILPKLSKGIEGQDDETPSDVKFGFGGRRSIIRLISHPIEGGSLSNFVGGTFSTHGYRFKIIEVINRRRIRVEGINEISSTITDGDVNSSYTNKLFPIDVCDGSDSRYYTIHENLKIPTNWGQPNPLRFKVEIDFNEKFEGWQEKDQGWEKDINGKSETINRTFRGFWGSALVEKEEDGIYIVTFNDIVHPRHPQQNADGDSVEFEKGILRAPYQQNDERAWKALNVLRIESEDEEKLKLRLYDDAIANEDNVIKIGDDIEVNYYPSYKCYLVAEESASSIFNEAHIFPDEDEGMTKSTILSLRATGKNPKDDALFYHSSLTSPKLIKAEKSIVAVKPEDISFNPAKPIYATPPDAYSKSTFSFKLPYQSEPYQIVVYRADLTAVLSALYNVDTVREIKNSLDANDEWFTQKLFDFVNLVGDGEEEEVFPLKVYGENPPIDSMLPNPNREGLEIGNDDGNLSKWKDELWDSFIPITEHPILFSSIKNNARITRKDPVKKITEENKTKLLITDFNLDGEKITSYFYMVRTIGSGADISEPNQIIGPVQLINNRALKAPIVRDFIVEYTAEGKPLISIKLHPVVQSDIKRIELRRSYTKLKAKNWRMMESVKTIDIDETNNLSIVDKTFRDEEYEYNDIQFGDTVYYRVNVQRKIQYTRSLGKDGAEYIPSIPSKIISGKLVDNKRPTPPILIFGENENSLIISCLKTCYNGTYILEKLNKKGIWKLVEKKKSLEASIEFEHEELNVPNNEGSPKIYLKYRIKVINTNGLDSGWGGIEVFPA